MRTKELPEEKFAIRTLKKHGLTVPFDVSELVSQYAKVIYRDIPINGVDGLARNIKTLNGKQPTIIINASIPTTRQLFTLAHELGHIIIPWHCGIDLEDADLNPDYAEYEYRDMEQEANRFAAELLMPRSFILKLFEERENLANLHQEICSIIGVSEQAAAIRMTQVLPPNIMYVVSQNAEIKDHGITNDSYIRLSERFPFIPSRIYPDAKDYSSFKTRNTMYHWWEVGDKEIALTEGDDRSWREILDEILFWEPDPLAFKRSLSGKIGSVNSRLQRGGVITVQELYTACYNRLVHDDELHILTKHKDFKMFLSKRIQELIANSTAKD